MNNSSVNQRVLITGLVLLAALAHLAWEHLHGGILSHSFFASEKFPPMHNGWGAILLPLLAWFLSAWIVKRGFIRAVVVGFVGAVIYALVISVSFRMGVTDITAAAFFAIFALCLLLRLYRAEIVLGFVLGMTFVFGPIIPLVFSALFAAISVTAHLLVYPLARRWMRGKRA